MTELKYNMNKKLENSDDSKGIEVITFGCRLNYYESQVMVSEAKKAGLEKLDNGAVLINTCAVTAEAVRQARQTIRKIRRKRPKAKIIVTGCAVQTQAESFGRMDEVDLALGNEEKLYAASYRNLPDFGVNDTEKIRVNDIMSINETASHMIDCIADRTRAFVQIQNGCNHRCTFCIIPFGRGNSRSTPMGSVVDQIKRLVGNGHNEIILTGVNITSYGADLPGSPSLGELTQTILRLVPDLGRLRLSSIDSIEVDESLMDVIASESRFMPHLHLSQQSGDDMILKRMKRRHLRGHSIEFCQKVKTLRPDMVFGADLIVGFPTENNAMFENTLALVDECNLTYLHVFPYSPRQGTPAVRMPQVHGKTIKERSRRLRQKGGEVLEAHLNRLIGKEVELLVEQKNRGHLADFTPAFFDEASGEAGMENFPSGTLLKAIAKSHDGRALHLDSQDVPVTSNIA